MDSNNEKSAAELLYPNMSKDEPDYLDIYEARKGADEKSRAVFPEMTDQEELKDLTEDDQQSMEGMNTLLDRGEFQELTGRAEEEVKALGLSEKETQEALNIIARARKQYRPSPEWDQWARTCIRQLHRAKAFCRKKRGG